MLKNMSKNSGQSLVEMIIAISLSAILISTATGGIVMIIRSNEISGKTRAATDLTTALAENLISVAEGNWHSIYGLNKGSANKYYLATSTGLSYYRVFVTSTSYSGNLGGLSGADAKCQARADAVSLGGNWKAWISTNSISAASRLEHSSVPYKLINGELIANNWEDLTDGALSIPIYRTETGAFTGYDEVWTDTFTSGASEGGNYDCTDWTSSAGVWDGRKGFSGNSNRSWTSYLDLGQSLGLCADGRRLYCFEQPTSSPGSLVVQSGTEHITLDGFEFTRYFYIENVNRDAGGNIAVSGTDDPSTQKATVVVSYNISGSDRTITETLYLTRWRNSVFRQTDWSGGSGQAGPITGANNKFDSSINVDYTTTPGVIFATVAGDCDDDGCELISSVFDTGSVDGAGFNTIMWQGTLPSGASVKFKFASSDTYDSWNWGGAPLIIPAGPNFQKTIDQSTHNNNRYFRYKIIMEKNGSGQSPLVEDMIVGYSP